MDAPPPPELQVNALDQVVIYLDVFISTGQGDPTERCQMLYHLFWSTNTFLRTNVYT